MCERRWRTGLDRRSHRRRNGGFPVECLDYNFKVFTITTGRGPIVASALWQVAFCGYLTWCWFGILHDQWNALKNAAKQSMGGRAWHAIAMFLSVWNLNQGPFRSHAWYRAKQEVRERWLQSHTHLSSSFRAIMPWFGALNGVPDTTQEEAPRVLFHLLRHLRSFANAGPVCKLMR